MFVLRRITSEDNEMNDCIGDRYHIVMQERNEDEFKKSLDVTKSGVDPNDGLYGFVIYTLTDQMIHYPLYKRSSYYIMMSDGQTFANITYR